jgi:hypothetical protein
MHVLEDGINRLIRCCIHNSFNVFVDIAPGPSEWGLSYWCIDKRLIVKVPHNLEVATHVVWDIQLMSDIPIHLLVLALDDLRLQVQSCPPPQHAEECSAQW